MTKYRMRVYMNLDVDTHRVLSEDGTPSIAKRQIREAAETQLAQILEPYNPEFHSVRLVRGQ